MKTEKSQALYTRCIHCGDAMPHSATPATCPGCQLGPRVLVGQGEYLRPLPPDRFLMMLAGIAYAEQAIAAEDREGGEQGPCATCGTQSNQRCFHCGAWCHAGCLETDGCRECGRKITNQLAARLLDLGAEASVHVPELAVAKSQVLAFGGKPAALPLRTLERARNEFNRSLLLGFLIITGLSAAACIVGVIAGNFVRRMAR